jgi:hypothetical protein
MQVELPKIIETYVRAINAHDAAGLQASFASDALVKDVGREFRGSAAIKGWAAREIFAVKVRLDPIEVKEQDGQCILTVRIDGTFDRTGLPDPLVMDHCFTIEDDRIKTLTCRLAARPVEGHANRIIQPRGKRRLHTRRVIPQYRVGVRVGDIESSGCVKRQPTRHYQTRR